MFTRKVDATAVSFGLFSPPNELLGHLTRENGNIAYCKSHNAVSSQRHVYYNKNRRLLGKNDSLNSFRAA